MCTSTLKKIIHFFWFCGSTVLIIPFLETRKHPVTKSITIKTDSVFSHFINIYQITLSGWWEVYLEIKDQNLDTCVILAHRKIRFKIQYLINRKSRNVWIHSVENKCVPLHGLSGALKEKWQTSEKTIPKITKLGPVWIP